MSDPEEGARRTWTLRGRLVAWGTGVLLGAWVLGGVLVVWILGASLRRELDTLAVEECAELAVRVLEDPVDAERIRASALDLDREHPELHVSLRVWRGEDPTPWLTGGAIAPVPWPAGPPPRDEQTTRPGRFLRRRSLGVQVHPTATEPGGSVEHLVLELLIDGRPRARQLARMGGLLMALSGVGVVLGSLACAFFSQRLSRLLEQVARSASSSHLDEAGGVPPPEGAPAEIRRVVRAFDETIGRVRAEHSRNVLLTAGLAHELRSPLQNLISEAEVSLLREREAGEYRDLIRRQLDELRELALVVDNMITLTALRDMGRLSRQEWFDYGAEIQLRLSQERREADRRGVRLEVRELGDMSVRGDREALVLMLRNLVGNAVRWTPPGTTVETTIDGRAEHLVVSVSDRGRGVDPAEREAIFEAFYQGSPPHGERAGYGLGLALARRAARAHGGEIEVGDAPAGGARFEVRLPR